MVTTVKLQSKLEQHFRYLGIEGSQLTQQVLKWHQTNGASWTVNRLKTLKSQFIHIMSGQYIDHSWISFRGKTPKGVFGPLFRSGVLSRKNRKVTIAALNSYLVFIGSNTSKMHDVLENIAKPISDEQKLRSSQLFVGDRNFFLPVVRKQLRRAVSGVAYYDNIHVKTNTGSHTGNPFGHTWVESLEATRDCILPTEAVSSHYVKKTGVYHPPPVVGELVPLYERGDKVRIVAMPYAEIQLWLEPLHSALNKALRCIKEDCTFDQIKGASFAHKAMKDGRLVHSVDLSAATDRFPYVFQEMVLRDLFPDPDMVNWGSIYNRLVNSKWKSPIGDIIYGAGQPMGTYGSFALFALSHHALLHSLCMWNSIPLEPDGSYPYRILGDDIIIINMKLYDRYRSVLQQIGVGVSQSKSINSSVTAEFAGFLIDKRGPYKPVKPAKFRLDKFKMIQYLQTSGENHFSGRIGDVAELMKFLPEPYGAGLNPMGQSSATRLNLYGFSHDESHLRDSIPEVDILPILNSVPGRNTKSSWVSFTNTEDTISYLSTVQVGIRTELLHKNNHVLHNNLKNLGNNAARLILRDGIHEDSPERDVIMRGVTSHSTYMCYEDLNAVYRKQFPLYLWNN